MAFSRLAGDIIGQVADRVFEKQPKRKEKANTVVVVVGLILTVLLSGLTWLLEAQVEFLPDFTAQVVSWLGMALTAIKVYYTKNGVTRSTVEEFQNEVNSMVDEQEWDQGRPKIPEPVAPVTGETTDEKQNIANELDQIAKRLA